MGSFSWLRADNLTQRANIAYGDSFKLLIPKEFGGGFIKDRYQDYGHLGTREDGEPMYDIYELLAYWNADMRCRFQWLTGYEGKIVYVGSLLKPMLDGPARMKPCDKFTDENREVGIELLHHHLCDLPYPLKLVSASYSGTYEDCLGVSISDPCQGFGHFSRRKLSIEYAATPTHLMSDDWQLYWNRQRLQNELKEA